MRRLGAPKNTKSLSSQLDHQPRPRMLSASLHSHRNSRHRAHKCQCKLGKLMCSRLNSSAPRIPRYPPLSGHCLATCQMHSFLNQLLPTTPPPTTSPHHLPERTKMQKYATYNREIIEQNALTPGLHPPNPTPSAEAQPNRGKKRRKRLTSVSHTLTSALRSVVCPSNPQTQKENLPTMLFHNHESVFSVSHP